MSPIIGPNPKDRDEWLAARQKLITATDIAHIKGGGGWTVYHEKRGDIAPFAGNAATRRGNRFQRPVLEEYADEAGVCVFDELPLIIDGDCPQLAATPDAIANPHGTVGVTYYADSLFTDLPAEPDWFGVEAKTSISPVVAAAMAGGDDESDMIPEGWIWQATAQMACCNWPRVDFAILLFGRVVIRRVLRNDTLVDACRATAVEYAERIAKGMEPPMACENQANQDAIKNLYGKPVTGKAITLSEADAELWAKRKAAAKAESAAKKDKTAYDTAMRAIFKDAELGTFPDGATLRIGTVNVVERFQEAYSYTRFWYKKPKT